MCHANASRMPLRFDPVAEARRNWAQHWGDDPVPSMSAVTSIMRVQQILLARLNDTLKPFDLTFPRYEALMLLYYSRQGALPLGKMGDRLQVHRTSVTNIIDGLEKSGFVTREPHERDRRTTLANITPIRDEKRPPRRPRSSIRCTSAPSPCNSRSSTPSPARSNACGRTQTGSRRSVESRPGGIP